MDGLKPTKMPAGPEAPPRLVVNLLSASEDFQNQGVHTAFLQTREALRRVGVEVRVNSSERADIVHIQTMGLLSLLRLLRNPSHTVVTAHVVPDSFVDSFALARTWLPVGTAYLKFFYGRASEVVAVSPDVAQELEDMGIAAPVRFLPNAVDRTRFRPDPAASKALRSELGISDGTFVALGVGQVQPRKGVECFVETARALPDMTFVWVGDMPFKRLTAGYDRMVRLVADAPPNCMFVGSKDYDEMPRWYAAADCLFFPSRHETFGLAIVEGAAAGLPLLLGDLDTYRPLFGEAAIMAEDAAFVPWLERLRSDLVLRQHYSHAATEVAALYDPDRLAEGLLEMYAGVLARAGAKRRGARSGRTRTRPKSLSTPFAWRGRQ